MAYKLKNAYEFGLDGASVISQELGIHHTWLWPVEIQMIPMVETKLTQLWKLLEYQKKCSAHIKVCDNLRKIQVSDAIE